MNDYATKVLKVKDNNVCEYCDGEGDYESMTLGADGEPVYHNEKCICQIEDTTPEVNVMTSKLTPIMEMSRVMGEMIKASANEMSWIVLDDGSKFGKPFVISTTRPTMSIYG